MTEERHYKVQELVTTGWEDIDEEWNSNFQDSIQHYRSNNLQERVTDAPEVWSKEVEPLKFNEIEYEKL